MNKRTRNRFFGSPSGNNRKSKIQNRKCGVLATSIFQHVSLFAASPSTKIVVTFGGLNERSGVLFVAKDAGIFQKHGLDADVVGVRSGPVGMAALAAGETQFHGGSATGASIGAMASGLDLVFLAGLINKLDGLFVASPSIRSPADLKGKRIGVQSIGGALGCSLCWLLITGDSIRTETIFNFE